jgi:hypothetical protein
VCLHTFEAFSMVSSGGLLLTDWSRGFIQDECQTSTPPPLIGLTFDHLSSTQAGSA